VTGIAFARAVEISFARFGVAGQHVLGMEERRGAQRIVHALMNEVRKIQDLSGGKIARRSALRRMALLQKRPDLIAVAIVQHGHRANQVGPTLAASGAGAVTGNALGDVGLLAAVGGGRIDDLFIQRSRLVDQVASAAARGRLSIQADGR